MTQSLALDISTWKHKAVGLRSITTTGLVGLVGVFGFQFGMTELTFISSPNS